MVDTICIFILVRQRV